MNPASAGELEAVLALVRLVYGFEMSSAFYRWRFLENPFGGPLVTLLWDGDTLAGHYAASPIRAWYRQSFPAAQSMTTMTHPGYRNQGVFTALASDLYRRMTDTGIRMIWGLPNTQSHYGFVTKLGWRDIALLFTMTRFVSERDQAAAVEELVSPPESTTQLFERSDDGRVFASQRDVTYFRWRYETNPLVRYRYFTLPGHALDVFVVTKEYATSPTTKALEVVDYLYGREPRLLGELLRNLIGWARAQGCNLVRTWMSMADPGFRELEKLAFVPKEPLAYFGGRMFGNHSLPDERWNHGGFYLTMGDSDNY